MTDSEIIGKMFSEPDEGFRLLFDEYHQYVYTIAYNILRKSFNSHDIKECVVDVMSDVMMNYDRNNGSLAFIPIIHISIWVNKCVFIPYIKCIWISKHHMLLGQKIEKVLSFVLR